MARIFHYFGRAHSATVSLPYTNQSALIRENLHNAVFRLGILLAMIVCLMCAGVGSASAQSLTAPSSLVATTFSKYQISLQWTDPNPASGGSQETGYVIERAKGSPSAFSEASVTGANVTSWPNMSLSAGTTYYFRVRAFVISGGVTTYSGYSPVASAATQ